LSEPKLYTVLIVPHQGSQMRTFAVSRPFAITAGLLAVVLFLGGIAFPPLFLSGRRQSSDIEGLRSHNAALSRDMRHVDQEMARLQGQIDHYEHQARKFALMAGLESLPAELQASGGPGEVEDVAASPQAAVFEELNSLSAREARLGQAFQALAEAYKDREEYLDTVPTVSPVVGAYFGSNFGYRRDPFTGQNVFHRGQDIVANTGTPIRAPASGRVSRAGRTGGLGIAIYLSHGRSMVSRFGHLSKLNVRSGQQVKRGDIIGYVGSTGRSMGPHLHYEILVSGKHVDPRDFIMEDRNQPLS
jgi:murein DD-endopeptidase MepM/ murein hydrolase activator NlpD